MTNVVLHRPAVRPHLISGQRSDSRGRCAGISLRVRGCGTLRGFSSSPLSRRARSPAMGCGARISAGSRRSSSSTPRTAASTISYGLLSGRRRDRRGARGPERATRSGIATARSCRPCRRCGPASGREGPRGARSRASRPSLPNRPFRIDARRNRSPAERADARSGASLLSEPEQIDGGKNDRFVAPVRRRRAGDGLLRRLDAADVATGPREYTFADHFFMGAFGGSYLNHFWLVCACTPEFVDAPRASAPCSTRRGSSWPSAGSPPSALDGPRADSPTAPSRPDGYVVEHAAAALPAERRRRRARRRSALCRSRRARDSPAAERARRSATR